MHSNINICKRSLSSVICLLLLLAFLVLPVTASGSARLADEANLLSGSEAENLETRLNETSDKLDIDIVVVTTDSLEGKTSVEYADDYYDDHGFSEDGILLLVAMEDRDYAISTSGTVRDVFTENVIYSLEDEFLPELSSGDYSQAFSDFTEGVKTYYIHPEYANSYDDEDQSWSGDTESGPGGLFKYIPFSGVIGVILSFFITGQKKAALTSVKQQSSAGTYIKEENLTQKRDVFLYHTIHRTPIPKDRDRKGPDGHGSFSSGHLSSSGNMHGGSHGKF